MALGGDLFSYDGWAATNFNNSNDPDVIGKGADPDGDGIDNGGEYAQRTDPNSGDRSGLSGVGIEGDFLRLTYQRSKTANAQWLPQAAGDLENWQPGPGQVMVSDDGSTEIWKATDTVPITAGRPRFMRVRIIVP